MAGYDLLIEWTKPFHTQITSRPGGSLDLISQLKELPMALAEKLEAGAEVVEIRIVVVQGRQES